LIQLLASHFIEVMTSIVLTVIMTIFILNKLGFLSFSRDKDKDKGKDIEYTHMKQCPAHDELARKQDEISKKLNGVHDNQIKNISLHEQYQKRFDEGDMEIRKLKCDIKQLCIGVAVLLDRTGGQPKSFTERDIGE